MINGETNMTYTITSLGAGYFTIEWSNGRSIMHLGTVETAHQSALLQTEETFTDSDRVLRTMQLLGTTE